MEFGFPLYLIGCLCALLMMIAFRVYVEKKDIILIELLGIIVLSLMSFLVVAGILIIVTINALNLDKVIFKANKKDAN